MRKSFRDSLKLLEADIGHANTLYVVLPLYLFFSVVLWFFLRFLDREDFFYLFTSFCR